MKTRQGFVSNSSSSSFIIYGSYVGTSLTYVCEKVRDLMTDDDIAKLFDEGTAREDIDLDDLASILRESQYEDTGIAAIDDAGISVYYFDEWYVGFDIGISRNTLIHGHGFSEEQLDAIDALLKDLTGSTGSVHEGSYYN